MSLASLLNFSSRDVGECIVKIAGREFSEFYANLSKTTINLKRMGSADATLTFSVMREGKLWQMDGSDQLRIWAQIEIIAVFGEVEQPLFSGYIKEIKTDIGDLASVVTVTVECQDIFAAMDRNCRRITWDEDRDALDILREVIEPYGLKLVTDLNELTLDKKIQNVTDFRFIRGLASKKFEWYLRDQKSGVRELHFGNPQADGQTFLPKLMVRAGRSTNCFNFFVSYDGYKPDGVQFSTAPVSGDQVNIQTTQPNISLLGSQSADSSDRGLNQFEWCLPPEDLVTENRANRIAQSQADINSFKLKASGRLDGTAYGALLLPGSVVEVGGTGQNDGKWYVDSCVHTFESKGYFIDFELIRNAAAGDETSDEHILSGII